MSLNLQKQLVKFSAVAGVIIAVIIVITLYVVIHDLSICRQIQIREKYIQDMCLLDTISEWMYGEHGLAINMPGKGSAEFISKLVEQYSIDGLVMFSSKSCRMWNLSQLDVIDLLEKKHGIPGVVIEADMIDPAMISDSQIDTRLQALFEIIDGRREK